jgi:hypothetical protein
MFLSYTENELISQNVTVHISGVSGASADRHPSQASAQAAFADALAKGNVRVRI